jgi:hypothetical protein
MVHQEWLPAVQAATGGMIACVRASVLDIMILLYKYSPWLYVRVALLTALVFHQAKAAAAKAAEAKAAEAKAAEARTAEEEKAKKERDAPFPFTVPAPTPIPLVLPSMFSCLAMPVAVSA